MGAHPYRDKELLRLALSLVALLLLSSSLTKKLVRASSSSDVAVKAESSSESEIIPADIWNRTPPPPAPSTAAPDSATRSDIPFQPVSSTAASDGDERNSVIQVSELFPEQDKAVGTAELLPDSERRRPFEEYDDSTGSAYGKELLPGEIGVPVEIAAQPAFRARSSVGPIEKEAEMQSTELNMQRGDEAGRDSATTTTRGEVRGVASLPPSMELILQALNDFSNIAMTNGSSRSSVGAVSEGETASLRVAPPSTSTRDGRNTALCRKNMRPLQPWQPSYTTNWQQRVCITQTYRFAESEGAEPDAILLGDATLGQWPRSSPETWEWVAGEAVGGKVANLGCDIDSSSSYLQASTIARRFPVSPRWWVLNVGRFDCLSGKEHGAVVENVKRTIDALRRYNCHSNVVVMALLPAAEEAAGLSWSTSPSRQCIETVNALLSRHINTLTVDSRLSFLDCNPRFLSSPGGDVLDSRLIPDGKSLSSLGYANVGLCLAEHMVAQPAPLDSSYPFDFDFRSLPPEPTAPDNSTFWEFTPWSNCTASCGTGVQTRDAKCKRRNDGGTVETAPDSACDESSLHIFRTCAAWDCLRLGWVSGPWGECSHRCGDRGLATRVVKCIDHNARMVDDSECAEAGLRKPAISRQCNTQECHDGCGPLHRPLCSGHGFCSFSTDVQDISGVCKCDAEWGGVLCEIPDSCPSGVVAVTNDNACCDSGLVAPADGTCCPFGAAIDASGQCCDSGRVDGCGVCDGRGTALDVFGACCETELDGAGFCCTSGLVDECGVCGGSGSTCDLIGFVTLNAPSAAGVWANAEAELRRGLAGVMDRFGVEQEQLAVTSVQVNAGAASSSEEVGFRVSTSNDNGGRSEFLTVARLTTLWRDLQTLPHLNLTDLYGLSRTGSCGNGVCELDEQVRVGLDGVHSAGCLEDCPVRRQSCPVPPKNHHDHLRPCSGHGLCSPINGVCFCQPGYSGDACDECSEGYAFVEGKVGGGRCVPVVPPVGPAEPTVAAASNSQSLSSVGMILLYALLGIVAFAVLLTVVVHVASVIQTKASREAAVTLQNCSVFAHNDRTFGPDIELHLESSTPGCAGARRPPASDANPPLSTLAVQDADRFTPAQTISEDAPFLVSEVVAEQSGNASRTIPCHGHVNSANAAAFGSWDVTVDSGHGLELNGGSSSMKPCSSTGGEPDGVAGVHNHRGAAVGFGSWDAAAESSRSSDYLAGASRRTTGSMHSASSSSDYDDFQSLAGSSARDDAGVDVVIVEEGSRGKGERGRSGGGEKVVRSPAVMVTTAVDTAKKSPKAAPAPLPAVLRSNRGNNSMLYEEWPELERTVR